MCSVTPKSECPDVRIRLSRYTGPETRQNIEVSVVSLERTLYGHPLADLLWLYQFENVSLQNGLEIAPTWKCLFVHRQQGLLWSVYVDDIIMARKKQNLGPMWKLLTNIIIKKPTKFLDSLYLVCTERECKSEQQSRRREQKDVPVPNFRRSNKRVAFFWDVQWESDSVVPRHGGTRAKMHWTVLRSGKQQYRATKSPQLVSSIIRSRRMNWKRWENFQRCPQKLSWCASIWCASPNLIFCGLWTNWHEWSRNWLESVTDAWLVWFPTVTTRVTSGILSCGKHGRKFQTRIVSGLWFCRRHRGRSIDIRKKFVNFRRSTLCSNELDVQEATALSHSSKESEVPSLDDGLRIDGIPAIDLWDLVLHVLHSSSSSMRTARPATELTLCEQHPDIRTKLNFPTSEEKCFREIDYGAPNAKLFDHSARTFLLCTM